MGLIDTIKEFIGGNVMDQAQNFTDGLEGQVSENLGSLGDTLGGFGDQINGEERQPE